MSAGGPVRATCDLLHDERPCAEPRRPQKTAIDSTSRRRHRFSTIYLCRTAYDRLAEESEEKRFEVLKGFLLDEKGDVSYEEAAKQLDLSVAAITSAIFRMRGRFRALLYEEIANTVESPDEVEPEVRHMLAALNG